MDALLYVIAQLGGALQQANQRIAELEAALAEARKPREPEDSR